MFNFLKKRKAQKERIELLKEALIQSLETSTKNDQLFDKYINDDDYGLISSKPIYTCQSSGSIAFLNKLKTINGECLTWKRTLAISVQDIDGIVDEYSCFLETGEKYGTIYLNMYSSQKPSKAPKGYIYLE